MDSGKTGSGLSGLARIAAAGGIIALAAGAIPGCIIVADGTRTVVVSEPSVDNAALDKIQLGQTTEDQLRELLGTPTGRSLDGDTQVWTYKGVKTSKSDKTVVYIDDDDDEIRTETVYRGKVTIELTGGVVTAVRRE